MSTQKKDVIVKVGECWITPETVETHVPKNCVVNCDPVEMNIVSDFPALLKLIDGVKYEVYGKDREDYEDAMENLRNRIVQKEYENAKREES